MQGPGAQLHVSLQNLPPCGTIALGKGFGILQMHCIAKTIKLQGLQATLLHNAPGKE
jgi:hypothetical protein